MCDLQPTMMPGEKQPVLVVGCLLFAPPRARCARGSAHLARHWAASAACTCLQSVASKKLLSE